MRTPKPFFFGAFAAVFLSCGSLAANPVTLTLPATGDTDSLPIGDVDTLSIQLIPANGAVDGVAGATVGWGFIVNWNSTNGDWINFTGSSLSPNNFPNVGQYTDFIGGQGGPVDFGLSPGSWMEDFDAGTSQGVGSYLIAGDAAPPSIDTGDITFNFEVYAGDPTTTNQIGQLSPDYSYSTGFLVTVDAPASGAPEPGSVWLFGTGLVLTGWLYGRRPRQTASHANNGVDPTQVTHWRHVARIRNEQSGTRNLSTFSYISSRSAISLCSPAFRPGRVNLFLP